MDTDSSAWVSALSGSGPAHHTALARLHELLLKVGFLETRRRGPAHRIAGPELDDIAHQAADDAMVSLLGKLDTFRGESRFTTWAYRFVVLEVSSKLGRHFSRHESVTLDEDAWDRLPARFGDDPLANAQHSDLIAAVRRAVDEALTARQRELFVAIVVNGIPTEAMAVKLGASHGAVYKTVFDARRKIRAHLTAHGYLDADSKNADTTQSGNGARRGTQQVEVNSDGQSARVGQQVSSR
jgi:RNA polymerase sigma-70 factor, ECF subfamily